MIRKEYIILVLFVLLFVITTIEIQAEPTPRLISDTSASELNEGANDFDKHIVRKGDKLHIIADMYMLEFIC